MFKNQLFFEDFQKVFKVKIVEKKSITYFPKSATESFSFKISFWLKRVMVKLNVNKIFLSQ